MLKKYPPLDHVGKDRNTNLFPKEVPKRMNTKITQEIWNTV